MSEAKSVFSYGIQEKYAMEDYENRHLYLGDIDETSADEFVYHVNRYNREDALNGIDVENRKKIFLFISSGGGDVLAGLSICDSIRLSKTPIVVINYGICYSMALLIYITAKLRYAYPNSSFLMHEGEISLGRLNTNKMFDYAKWQTEVESRLKSIICDNTAISEEFYESHSRREFFFFANLAKELKVVDFIIGDDITLEELLSM